MKNGFSHIFEDSDHIDESTLWLYSRGKLSHEEANKVEKHLVDCQMCTDVVDGFSLFETEGSFNASHNRVSESFFNKKRTSPKLIIRSLSIAAMLLLLAGSSYVFINHLNNTKNKKTELAQEIFTDEIKINESDIKKAELIEDTSFSKNINEEIKSETATNHTNITPEIQTIEELNLVSNNYSDDDTSIDLIIFEEETEDYIDIESSITLDSDNANLQETAPSIEMAESINNEEQFEKKEYSSTTTSENDEDFTEIPKETQEPETISKSKNKENSEFKLFNHKNRYRSIRKFENSTYDIKEESLLSQGLNKYNNKEYNKSIEILSLIPPKDSAYWDAKWIIADSYVKLYNIEKAIEQYRILQDTASPYKYSAEEKLRKLGE